MSKSILTREPVRLANDIVLPRGRVHEVLGPSGDSFAVLLASQLQGSVIWVGRGRDVSTLTPQALKGFLDPTRMVLIEAQNRKDILWASEQAMRSRGAALVVMQMGLGPDLKESRRLQLACEQGGGIGLILIERRAQSSAAQTRWVCGPSTKLPIAANDDLNASGWSWELTKNKAGPIGRWQVEWKGRSNGQKGHVHMVAATAA